MPSRARVATQASLFDDGPPGLATREDFITVAEERTLLEYCETQPFQPFAFQGWQGKRETVSFGWRYDSNEGRVQVAPPIPALLLPLRARAADFAGVRTEALEQALVIRYDVGAGIGWHRDRPVFDQVVGISLLSHCVLRFRRRDGQGFRRYHLQAAPRSAYLLSGEIRRDWEHSIAAVQSRRYSITFRSRSNA
jgi:alkylated DNA repair dioxygenase AlkB